MAPSGGTGLGVHGRLAHTTLLGHECDVLILLPVYDVGCVRVYRKACGRVTGQVVEVLRWEACLCSKSTARWVY